MNKLWLRLSIAFALVALVAVGLLSLVVQNQTNRAFVGYLRSTWLQGTPLQETLVDYYRTHGSWEGVEDILGTHMGNGGPHWRRSGAFPGLVLVDASGRVVYQGPAGSVIHSLSASELRQALPVQVDGKTVGYVLVRPPHGGGPHVSSPETLFLDRMRQVLLMAALLAILVSMVLGLGVSRTLTAPLRRLAEAARAVGAQEFHERVPLAGPDEVVEVARAFNDMAEALEAAKAQQRQMLADIAHELRTPLSVLQANLRAMLDGVYPMEPAEIATLYDEARLLNRLVEDVRDLALADMGQLPLHREQVDLIALVQQTASVFGVAADAQGIRLRVDVPKNASILVEGDPDRLAQVLRNLLSNALRHTPPGGEIRLRVVPKQEAVRVEVEDTGEGIPPEDREHVFDRFWRADTSRARQSGGTGLGLAIARSIIEAHGGRIGVESEPEQGSTFWFELPLIASPRREGGSRTDPQG